MFGRHPLLCPRYEPNEPVQRTRPDLYPETKISFASNYFYDVGMGFPKMSMIAFYWAYFPANTGSAMRKALWSITALVGLSYMAILWDDTFYCGKNVSVQWSQEDGACSVFYADDPFILNFTLNLACYLAGMTISPFVLSMLPSSHESANCPLPSIRPPPRIVDSACSHTLAGSDHHFCPRYLDHPHHCRTLRHALGRHRPGEPRL